MKRTDCHNAVLFYDELSALTDKAGIDCSSLKSHLLSLAESGRFSNTIKSKKSNFHFAAGTYCASVICCTTNELFEDQWSKLAGKSTGLDDRFVFVLQPKELPELKPEFHVSTLTGSLKTRELIDRAIQRKVYSFDDTTQLKQAIGKLGNRTTIRAEKWSLFFAIDQGLDSITDDCVKKGLAVAQYEKDVKKYLGSPEAETKVAAAQLKYRRILERQFNGQATTRQMQRAMNADRYGTALWWQILDGGLVRAGIIGKQGHEVFVIEPLDE
jgi:hypothetical protein